MWLAGATAASVVGETAARSILSVCKLGQVLFSWSLLATVPKRKSRGLLDMNFLWTAEKGVWKVWKESNRKEKNKETGEENNQHTQRTDDHACME